MIGLLPFVFASLVWAVHIAGAPSCYRQGFWAPRLRSRLQPGRSSLALATISAPYTQFSKRNARRREAHPRGCSGGVMSLDHTAAKFKLSECAQVIGAPSSIRVLKRSV